MIQSTDADAKIVELLNGFYEKYGINPEQLPSMRVRLSKAGNLVMDMPNHYIIVVDQKTGNVISDVGGFIERITGVDATDTAAAKKASAPVHLDYEELNHKANMPEFLAQLPEPGNSEINRLIIWIENKTVYAEARVREGSLLSVKGRRSIVSIPKHSRYTEEDVLEKIRNTSYINGLSAEGKTVFEQGATALYDSVRETGYPAIHAVNASGHLLSEFFNKKEAGLIRLISFRSYRDMADWQKWQVENYDEKCHNMVLEKGELIFRFDLQTHEVTFDTKCQKPLEALFAKAKLIENNLEKYTAFKTDILQALVGTGCGQSMFSMDTKSDPLTFCFSTTFRHVTLNEKVHAKAVKTETKAVIRKIKQAVKENELKEKEMRKRGTGIRVLWQLPRRIYPGSDCTE